MNLKSLRAEIVRQFQMGRAEQRTGTLIGDGPYFHSGEELWRLARERGLKLGDFDRVHCSDCGADGSSAAAFQFSFGHWPECGGQDSAIRFVSTSPQHN